MKLPRRLLLVLAVLALSLLGLTLAVRFLLPVDRYVLAALDEARALTGAEVTVGDARVDLWPTPRVVLADVAARGSGEALAAAGAASGVAAWVLTVASVTARPDWRELAHRRAVLRDIRLRQPRLQWSAAGGGAASLAQADAATFAPVPGLLRVEVDAARWNGTALDVDAELAGWPAPTSLRGDWRLRECEPAVLFAALPRPPTLGATPVAGLAGGEVAAEGRFDWPWPLPAPLRFRDLAPGLSGHAEVAGLAVSFAGSAEPWTLAAKAGLQAGRLEVSEAAIGIGDGRVTGRLTVTGLESEAAACRFEAKGEDLPLAELLRVLAPGALPYVEGTAGADVNGGFALGPPAGAGAGLAFEAAVRARDGVVHASSWLTDIAPYLGRATRPAGHPLPVPGRRGDAERRPSRDRGPEARGTRHGLAGAGLARPRRAVGPGPDGQAAGRLPARPGFDVAPRRPAEGRRRPHRPGPAPFRAHGGARGQPGPRRFGAPGRVALVSLDKDGGAS
ncbi:MAG: hypothetical protein IPM94_01905 [bacterium]|nr:hypothetical protein [bacterium]